MICQHFGDKAKKKTCFTGPTDLCFAVFDFFFHCMQVKVAVFSPNLNKKMRAKRSEENVDFSRFSKIFSEKERKEK